MLQPSDVGLGQLFIHTRDAVVVANLNTGRIALWNPAAERLFGWTADEAIGRPIEILIPPAIMRLHYQGLALYRRSGQGSIIDSGAAIEVPAATASGEEIHVELNLVTLEHTSGQGNYVMAMLRDASDRRRAGIQSLEAARAETARDEAASALREHHRLVQEATDELRKEIVHLQHSVDRLRGAFDDDAPTADAAPTAPDEAPATARASRLRDQTLVAQVRTDRLRRKLDQLATFAAIKADQLELQLERVNLVPLISRVVADLRSRGTPCKVNVAMPQGLTAMVDPLLIEQAVRTLLELAVARNPHGCWIDVELRRPLVGLARLEIRDTGRAISDEVRERLLDPTKAEHGMVLSRSIVALHGGTLELNLPAEGGARVVVTLPTQHARVQVSSG
jgi:PAS domain S-box-containing protein